MRVRFLIFCFLPFLFLSGCRNGASNTVVIYTSQDEVYAEPILTDFYRQTGIKALIVYDSEAVKTVGLVNRLLSEKNHPQCDVFWNNEEFRTRQLAAHGVFREADGWRHLGFRSRRLVVNTNLLSLDKAPGSWRELTNAVWRGKIALAYPLFGTTSTHFQALRQYWGDAAWKRWCQALVENKPFLVDGNSVVVKEVERGEAWVGMTDSDDIAAAQREGFPVAALPLLPETLIIPNTVAVVKDCPHPEAAQKLFDYLSAPAVSEKLVAVHALEGATIDTTVSQTGLQPDWNKLLADLEEVTEELKQLFLR